MNPVARPEINDELKDFEVISENKRLSNGLKIDPKVHTFEDGSTYVGGIDSEGKRNGYGVSVTKAGDVYRGDWVNDKPHGNGRFIRWNGDYYQGGFKNGMPHGLGIAREGKSGIVYEGDYIDGKKIGNVKSTYPDSGYYIGKGRCILVLNSRRVPQGHKAWARDLVFCGWLKGQWDLYRR